ncbi:MAG: hypothetical protein AB7N53_04210, partial [Candidatus Binatia bacterium]
MPAISVAKIAVLDTDADSNGIVSPGDTLRYHVAIHNSGDEAAADVLLVDLPDASTPLVVGSVQTSAGVVAEGNASGDTTVRVNVGSLAGPGGTAIVSFRVTIVDPLPAGVTAVRNQAHVTGANFSAEPSDDPATGPAHDATATNVIAAPAGNLEKRAILLADADQDGFPSPGDTLLYQITYVNIGNAATPGGIQAIDILDPNTTLVVGSVVMNQGVITSGNNPGDTRVEALVGPIAGRGGRFTASFEATINDPLPAEVTQVRNQGLGFLNSALFAVTDDPTTDALDDATVTQVTGALVGSATKVATLFEDADGNGSPSAGDTLLYRFDFTNTGNTPLSGISAVDTPDPNTALVVGSVQLSLGTITSGNGPGDTTIAADIGTIPPGVRVQGSFLATIDDPLPAGVTQVSNQAQGFTFGFPTGGSDDPSTAIANDPTVTQVTD